MRVFKMSGARFDDVRMRGFRSRATATDVLALLASRAAPLPDEEVAFSGATSRVLAKAVVSTVDVPSFARSAMDGYAIRTSDTTGDHRLVGESFPARPFAGEVKPGEAVRITTGAPLPTGADAVVMAELAEISADGHIRTRTSVSPGKHIVHVGEDVTRGSALLPAGRTLRPQDVGLLASIGAATVNVVRKPRVAILVTGNELLPPGSVPTGFQIVDSNSPMLEALATRDGATVLPVRRMPDDISAIRQAIQSAAQEADVILATGGTSVGTEDHTPRVASEMGELAVHGVAVRPAGPLGVAFLSKGRLPLFLIPGNPVSCLCAYDLFAGGVIRRLGGRSWDLPYRRGTFLLTSDVESAAGRLDYVRVKIDGDQAMPLARGTSSLSTTVAADGFLLISPDRDRLTSGESVEVWQYD